MKEEGRSRACGEPGSKDLGHTKVPPEDRAKDELCVLENPSESWHLLILWNTSWGWDQRYIDIFWDSVNDLGRPQWQIPRLWTALASSFTMGLVLRWSDSWHCSDRNCLPPSADIYSQGWLEIQGVKNGAQSSVVWSGSSWVKWSLSPYHEDISMSSWYDTSGVGQCLSKVGFSACERFSLWESTISTQDTTGLIEFKEQRDDFELELGQISISSLSSEMLTNTGKGTFLNSYK